MTEKNERNEAERDPVLDLPITLEMKVEDVNVLLSLLSELPYKKVSQVLSLIRDETITQVQEQMEKKKEN